MQRLREGIYVSKTLLSKVKVNHADNTCGYEVLAWWTKKPLTTIIDECVGLKDSGYAQTYLKTWAQALKGAFMLSKRNSKPLARKYFCSSLVCKFCIVLICCSSLIVLVYAVAAYAKEHNCTIILLDDAQEISDQYEVKEVR
jgi:hypothetical protein